MRKIQLPFRDFILYLAVALVTGYAAANFTSWGLYWVSTVLAVFGVQFYRIHRITKKQYADEKVMNKLSEELFTPFTIDFLLNQDFFTPFYYRDLDDLRNYKEWKRDSTFVCEERQLERLRKELFDQLDEFYFLLSKHVNKIEAEGESVLSIEETEENQEEVCKDMVRVNKLAKEMVATYTQLLREWHKGLVLYQLKQEFTL